MTERIALTGIRPQPASIGAPGNHLRWAFKAALGFPADGFLVYRRTSQDFKPDRCLDLAKIPAGATLASGSSREGVYFYFSDTVRIQGSSQPHLRISPLSAELLELRFSEPAVYVRIGVGEARGPIALRAYAGEQLVANSPPLGGTAGVLEVAAPFISRVTVPLQFGTLREVCLLGAAADCKDRRWGDPVAKLPLPGSTDEALWRLEKGLRNRYAADRDAALRRYQPELRSLLGWLKLLQNPASSAFLNPGAAPDQLRLPSDDPKSALRSLQPLPLLLLAALDPNIARLLGLYWVDQHDAPDGPKPGLAYDYKVEGRWPGRSVACGLLFRLGEQEASLPKAAEPLVGDQLPGLRFRGAEPLGRVGLRWPRPDEPQGATQPVLFDLWRSSGARAEALTEKLPALVPAPAWAQPDAALFVDRDVPLGKYAYLLRPIDLFGQTGESIKSKPIELRDLEAPPAPVRPRASLAQPGYPWRSPDQLAAPNKDQAAIDLWFEYGDAQHRQAPDVKGFHVFWRAESLFESRPVTLHVAARDELPDGRTVYTVEVEGAVEADLAAFAGGVLARPGANRLPAADRHRHRVAQVVPPNRLRLAPTDDQLDPGDYVLVSDPRLQRNWRELELETPIRPPLAGLVLGAGDFRATAVQVQALAQQSDALELLPPGHRSGAPARQPPAVEVLLNRALLEPNLFAGGTLRANRQSYPILYSTSGPSGESATAARVGLPPGAAIASGDRLTLAAAAPFSGPIARAEPSQRGGLAIVLAVDAGPAGADHLVGGAVAIGGQNFGIVQASGEAARLRLELRPHGPAPANLAGLANAQARVSPPQVRSLTIGAAAPDELIKTSGGEVAFDARHDGDTTTFVGRVVSSLDSDGAGKTELLARLSEAALAAVQPGVTRARYHAPYRVRLRADLSGADGVSSNAGRLRLSILDGQARQSVFLAACAFDARQNASPLSAPAQVIAVRPPPSGQPGRPFPCGADAGAAAGYATPPDRHGRATVCLSWDQGDLSPAAGLRYEVARALDSGILASHRRAWLLGRVEAAPPVVAGPLLGGAITSTSFDAARGLYRVVMVASLGGVAPAALRGGRLSQNGQRFLITAAAAGTAGLELLVRPLAQGAPAAGGATLDGPPDYAGARADPDALRLLAEAAPDAFGLVTGVPIAAVSMIDEIPGIGRNCYFYRVRAVDAAENRSAWGPTSAPFRQVDTTPPEAPLLAHAAGGERMATLRWQPPRAAHLARYEVFRARAENELQAGFGAPPIATVPQPAAGGELSFVDAPLDGLRPDEAYFYCVVAVQRVPAGPASDGIIEVRSLPSAPARVRVLDPTPPAPPAWVRAAWWDTQQAQPATPATAAPKVRLEWTTAHRQARCTLFRREANGEVWRRVAADLGGSFDEAAGLAFFDFDDSADPTRAYEYKLRIVNRLDRANVVDEPVVVPRLKEAV